jgi:hypothetical protein
VVPDRRDPGHPNDTTATTQAGDRESGVPAVRDQRGREKMLSRLVSRG